MKIGSLFSGYGGLDLGVQAVLGGEVAWHVEYDKAPSRILAHHYPDIPNLGDVTTVDFTAVEPVDVLTGGYPCQPFSHAGKRKGTDDERHLWPHVLRALREMGPRLAILENVRGHLTLGFDVVLADLADLGWSAEWGVVRASDAGACHQRARLFILAYPSSDTGDERPQFSDVWRPAGQAQQAGLGDRAIADASCGQQPWPSADGDGLQLASEYGHRIAANAQGDGRNQGRPESAGVIWGPDASQRGHGVSPDADLAGLEGSQSAQGRDLPTGGSTSNADIAGSEARRDGGQESQRIWQQSVGLASSAANPSSQRHGARQDGRGVGRLDGEDAAGPREWEWAREVAGDRGGTAWGDYGPAIARWASVIGRPAPAPTEPGRTGQPRLSPRFVEWMMGLPDGWVTDPAIGISRNDQLKALGNGVVPQQAALALSLLRDHVEAVAA